MQSLRVAVAVTSRRLALCRAVSANISLPSTASRCLSTQASTKQTTNHTGVFGLKFDVPIIAAVRRQDRDLGSKASAAARGMSIHFPQIGNVYHWLCSGGTNPRTGIRD